MTKREIDIPEGGCPYRARCQFYDLPQKVNFGEDGWEHRQLIKDEYRARMCDSKIVPASTGVVHGSMGAEQTEYCQMFSILSRLDELKGKATTLPDLLAAAESPIFK